MSANITAVSVNLEFFSAWIMLQFAFRNRGEFALTKPLLYAKSRWVTSGFSEVIIELASRNVLSWT